MAKLIANIRQLSTQVQKIHSHLSLKLQPNYVPTSTLHQVPFGSAQPVYVIPNFLTVKECQHFRTQADAIGFQEATVDRQLTRSKTDPVDVQTSASRKEIRNNLRLIFDDDELANQLQHRLIQFNLPLHVPYSCNPRMKIYRYLPGQYFKRHPDGIFTDPVTRKQSRYTFMVYLNDNLTGGETQFHFDRTNHPIKPLQGQAVIFFHNLIHEGLPITEGQKDVLRSDLMFEIPPN